MSLYGSMFSGVSGMNSQGSAIAMSSDNIANLNTVGYKANSAHFSTFVTSSAGSTSYSSGGVSAQNYQLINSQGLLQSTGIVTDLAVSGDGMFVVNKMPEGDGEFAYTRAGSFAPDKRGNFVNKAGYYLMGWQLDSENRLPGEVGNLDTTSSALLDSLSVVSTRTIGTAASATTSLDLGMNLKASEDIYEGAGETMEFITTGTNNDLGASDVIVPDLTAAHLLADGDSFSFTPSIPGTTYTFSYGGVRQSADITGTVLGATTPAQTFTGATDGDNFTIVNPTSGTVTFTYKSAGARPTDGEFRNLNDLAEAINNTNGLSARVQGNFLYVAATNGTEGLTFADLTGSFAADLALTNVLPAANRFSTLEGLENLINSDASEGITASIENPLSGSSLKFYATDPLGTLTTTATAASATPAHHLALRNQFGLDSGAATKISGPAYDSTDDTKNMASGNITPQFSRNVRMYDALGTGHDFRIAYIKIDDNLWATEIYAAIPSEVTNAGDFGQIAAGTIEFNGDGTLRTVDAGLKEGIEIAWANEAAVSEISINWGTEGQISGTVGANAIGKSDGLGQLDFNYNVTFIENNGIEPGLLNAIEVDNDGIVIAKFSNGSSREVFKLPLAQFANPNGLQAEVGNVYTETNVSGNFNLKQANQGGTGEINSGQLENANVELSDELTKVIISQRGYQANSKIIKTVNEMLEELNRIL